MPRRACSVADRSASLLSKARWPMRMGGCAAFGPQPLAKQTSSSPRSVDFRMSFTRWPDPKEGNPFDALSCCSGLDSETESLLTVDRCGRDSVRALAAARREGLPPALQERECREPALLSRALPLAPGTLRPVSRPDAHASASRARQVSQATSASPPAEAIAC